MSYLGTREGLFRVTDDGRTLNAKRVLEINKPIMCLAADARGETCFVGFFQGGMMRTTDSGKHWIPVGTALPHQDVRALALHPAKPGVVYAGTEPAALYLSEDNGDTWRELEGVRTHPSAKDWAFPIRPKLGHVRTIEIHPAEVNTLLVGIEVGSLLKSLDAGTTWTELQGCGHDIHRAKVLQDPGHTLLVTTGLDTNVYAKTGYKGLFRSEDGGATFSESNTGLGKHIYCEDAICVDPNEPNRLYMASANGIPPYWASMTKMVAAALTGSFVYFVTPSWLRRPSGAQVVISRSDDSGRSWRQFGKGLPTPLFDMVWGMDALPDPDRRTLYLGTTGGDFWVSRDSGENWELGLQDLPVITQVTALAA